MKIAGFIIFFSIVLVIYALTNSYILVRGLHALPKPSLLRQIFLIALLFLILAYPVARLLERYLSQGLAELLLRIGAYYLAAMILAFFLLLFIDLVRLGNILCHYFPASWQQPQSVAVQTTFWVVVGIVITLTAAGAWNAKTLRMRELDIQLTKSLHSPTELNIVLVSDIHLGTLIHNSHLHRIVELINQQNPDVVLLAGDTFDEDIRAILKQNMAVILQNIKSRYGVYAIPGNHEYYSGIAAASSYLQQAGIKMLRDSVVLVANDFYLVGRDDRTLDQFGGKRKTLAELLQQVDSRYPVIVMDHQPFQLAEAQQNHVDLQLSGHTHHGQLLPINFITNWVYEKSWGYLRKGNTQYYVSCGVGTWGPPVRLGSRPAACATRPTALKAYLGF